MATFKFGHNRRSTLVGFAALLCTVGKPVMAETIRIDLRRKSEARLYQISVRAIQTGYDHAYVVIAAEDDTKAMSYQAFYGFYPDDPMSGSMAKEIYRFIVKGVHGLITREDRETLSHSPVHEVIAQIDSDRYRSALAMLDRWKGQTEYRLAFQDCVTFAADMARSVGMIVPVRLFKTPVDYVHALVESNRPK